MSDDRNRRAAENEALFRAVNGEVERLERRFGETYDNNFHIVCECGDLECQERLTVPIDDYVAVRADPASFFVTPGHEMPTTEDVVEAASGYNIVRKHPGAPEEAARTTVPPDDVEMA